ncbi:alcohol dehydrogenase [Apiospora marii]|uniref:Alcohol dehydrogenase n=1 Tax=Apiospora marii TaxID=335849 RepID=A0ABR1SUD5_9PEZI
MACTLPKTYRAAVFEGPGQPVVIRDLPLKPPRSGEVLVKVLACGVCHTDLLEQEGGLGPVFPRVPGHELVGDIVATGEGITRFKKGERVGGPWHGGHDGSCRQCCHALYQLCDNARVTGVGVDGGYAEYVLLLEQALVRMPQDSVPTEVAPLLCAGVSVFNSIRKMHVEQGNTVAIQGIGGLGHLAIQYARKMGYFVVAISSGDSKRDFSLKLGAHEFVDASKSDAASKLQELGGAALILATAPNPTSISALIGGLQPGGKLVVIAPAGPVAFDTNLFITRGVSVHGWPSGHTLDSEEAIKFANTHGVKAIVQTFPLADVARALDHISSGGARFRCVLVM